MSKISGKIIRVNNLPPKGERLTNVIYQVAVPGTATYIDYAVDENGDVKTPTLDKTQLQNDFSKVKTVNNIEPNVNGDVQIDFQNVLEKGNETTRTIRFNRNENDLSQDLISGISTDEISTLGINISDGINHTLKKDEDLIMYGNMNAESLSFSNSMSRSNTVYLDGEIRRNNDVSLIIPSKNGVIALVEDLEESLTNYYSKEELGNDLANILELLYNGIEEERDKRLMKLRTIKSEINNPLSTPLEYINGSYVKKIINNYQVTYEPTPLINLEGKIKTENHGSLSVATGDILVKVYFKGFESDSVMFKTKEVTTNNSILIDGEILCFEELLTGYVTEIKAMDYTPPNSPRNIKLIGTTLVFSSGRKETIEILNFMGVIMGVSFVNVKGGIAFKDVSSFGLIKGEEYLLVAKDLANNSSAPTTFIA